jgi:hypothetical protein
VWRPHKNPRAESGSLGAYPTAVPALVLVLVLGLVLAIVIVLDASQQAA